MVREKFLNTREVAEILGTGQEYVRQLLREGKIKGVKVGKKWKIKESDINKITEGVDNWVKRITEGVDDWVKRHDEPLEGKDDKTRGD